MEIVPNNGTRNLGADIHIDPETGEVEVIPFKHGREILKESGWSHSPEDNNVLDNDAAYQALGEFTPSSLDHETIQRELMHHLARHGFYSASRNHITVMSPEEQGMKSYMKRRMNRSGQPIPKHETPHQDGSATKKQPGAKNRMSASNAVWSKNVANPGQNVGTQFFDMNNNRINDRDVDKDGTVVGWNDKKIKHAASGATKRWFARIGYLRKAKDGLKCPWTGVNYGKDVDSYLNSRERTSTPRHLADVRDYFNSEHFDDNHKHETADHLRENFPNLFGNNAPTKHKNWLRGYGKEAKSGVLQKRKEQQAINKAKAEAKKEAKLKSSGSNQLN